MLQYEIIELIKEQIVNNLQFDVVTDTRWVLGDLEESYTLKVSYDDVILAEIDFGQTEVG